MSELFSNKNQKDTSYTASDIEVLEGLTPVRKRPGMYIGGIDKEAYHHLVKEVLDNAMDEVIAGFANKIEVNLISENEINIKDNGRGIPIDNHPKFPDKSALEVIFTTLHSGGKFSDKVYTTSGGLHGVGISVVNALSEKLKVEVVKDKELWSAQFSRGEMTQKLTKEGDISNRKGTSVTFSPDPEIFGIEQKFDAKKLYNLVKAKAYLFRGVEIKWNCNEKLALKAGINLKENFYYPKGLKDLIISEINDEYFHEEHIFSSKKDFEKVKGSVEWAIAWVEGQEGFLRSFCNTIPTPQGGTHETGFKSILVKGIKNYGELTNNKKLQQITAEDVLDEAYVALSIFINEPQFAGQTKEKLVSAEATKLVENTIKDEFDHWLAGNREFTDSLINSFIQKLEARLAKKNSLNTSRKNVVSSLRLPGKLADCSRKIAQGTELYIVEGDSAGGSAKQARLRETQAILPLRGKILNVANSSNEKINNNQEISALNLTLGCGLLEDYQEEDLRYEKVIIMTDADVDGSHITALLMTYFFLMIPKLVENGHLYLAKPPLYKVTCNNENYYVNNDKEKDLLIKKLSSKYKKIDISRFKGLGEMNAKQLKETTMDPATRTLIKVNLPKEFKATEEIVSALMGKKAELRFNFIKEQLEENYNLIINQVDI